MTKPNTNLLLTQILKEHHIDLFGWSPLRRPLSMTLYAEWIDHGHHLDMTYLKDHLAKKENPELSKPARSAIVFSIPYWPHPWPSEHHFEHSVALYARGQDYHREIPKTLQPLLTQLRKTFPNEGFELFTDSAPVLERDLAYRAGLGWIGKNTCLINRQKGSLFFLAEIYTTLDLLNEKAWSPDFCGQCNKCVESCPTEALSGHRELLPARCISYWTIEAKSNPPEDLRPKMKDWLFGCDICQTVCPWNQKPLKQYLEAQPSEREQRLTELQWILTASRKELARHFQETALARAAGWKLQRNAIIVATNQHYTELIPSIESHKNDAKLKELVEWSLRLLKNNRAL